MFDRILDWFSSKHGLKELVRRLDVPLKTLLHVDLTYSEFEIKKKSGKPRKLAAPNDDLKNLQRRMLRRLLKKLKTHSQATGFQPGVSFLDNARCHECQDIVIRIDLVDFFASVSWSAVRHYFRRIGWNRQASRLLANLTTYAGSLPQGAPTSPRLSNLINYFLDIHLARLADEYGAVYTRYADDITFSLTDFESDLHEMVSRILGIIRSTGYRPHIKRKFDIRRRHQRQIVTGLVVNEKANLSRETRRWLRSVEHRHKLQKQGGYFGPKPTIDGEQLQGWMSLREMLARR